MRVQLTLNQVSLCCYAAMNMIDRWVCRRKVRGALEVEVELWDGREEGVGLEAASTDHTRDHAALSIPISSCTGITTQISSSVNSVHTWMHT